MLLSSRNPRRGSAVLVLCTLLAFFLVGMAAFAVDLGYIAVVRGELQNAADSAALAGATQLLSQEAQLAVYNANKNGASIKTYFTGDNAARREAQAFGQLHRGGGVPLVLDKNLGNGSGGDIVLGYINPSDTGQAMTSETFPYNSVQVRTYRNATHSGSLSLFFARALGVDSRDVSATATATVISSPWKLIPIAMHVDDYRRLLDANTDTGETDSFTYNPDWPPNSVTDFTNRVTGGNGGASSPDGIAEFKLYPDKGGTPGNFGTVDLGFPSGSTSDIRRQILDGLNPSDIASLNQQGKLTNGKLEATTAAPVTLSGDTGVSWTIEDELQQVVGQARTIPVYNSLTGQGTGAVYSIVGFVNVVILKADNGGGSGGGKRVYIQPIAPFRVLSSPEENGLGGLALTR